jgi:hypothetical protein
MSSEAAAATTKPEPTTESPAESSSERGDFLSVLQHLGGAFAVAVAGLYAIGLLITNEYLMTLGFADFNLLRPKCIITGAWAVSLLLACAGPTISLLRFKDDKIGVRRLFVEIALGYLVAMGMCQVLFAVLTFRLWNLSLFAGVLLLPLTMSIGPVVNLLITIGTYKRLRPQPAFTRHTAVMAYIAISPILATFVIAMFIYPNVTGAIGGGKPQPAKLVLSPEGVTLWKQLAAPTLKGHDAVAIDLYILHETETHMILRLKQFDPAMASVVSIDKKAIMAVVPIPVNLFSRD